MIRIFGTYTIHPQPESSGKFHHLVAIELTLPAAGHARFLDFVLFICFDIGTVDNIAAYSEPAEMAKDTVTDRNQEPGIDKHLNCSGNGSNKAAWEFHEDQPGSGLFLKYHLQLEVDSKPLLIGYKLCANFEDDDGAKHEIKQSEVRCLHNAQIYRPIP